MAEKFFTGYHLTGLSRGSDRQNISRLDRDSKLHRLDLDKDIAKKTRTYVIRKRGQKKPVGVFDSEDDADKYMETNELSLKTHYLVIKEQK